MKKDTVKKFIKEHKGEMIISSIAVAGGTALGWCLGVKYGEARTIIMLDHVFPELNLEKLVSEKIKELKAS